jgi:hypothetical protein
VSTPNLRPGHYANQRRSQRIMFSVPIRVSGQLRGDIAFSENCATLIVNAHGGLILLKARVFAGQVVTVCNVKTREEVSCTIVDMVSGAEGIHAVGIEFEKPNARFWRVAFPPPDWTPRSPEAKVVVHTPAAATAPGAPSTKPAPANPAAPNPAPGKK